MSFYPCPPEKCFTNADAALMFLLKVVITVEIGVESEACDGETIVVGRHGALIATAFGLTAETKISTRVYNR